MTMHRLNKKMKYDMHLLMNISVIMIGLILIAGCYGSQTKSIQSASSDLKLINFKGKCGESDFGPSEPKILEKKLDSDILKVKVLTAATCCVDFKGEIEYSDTTINLKFTETGDPCDCICTTTLYYEISGAASDNFDIRLNGKKIS